MIGDYGNSMFAILQGGVVGRAASIKEPDRALKTRKSWASSISQLWNRPKVAEYRPAGSAGWLADCHRPRVNMNCMD